MLNNGFGFMNSGNGLPYPADQLIRSPININVQNPPFVPQVACTNEMRQFLPVISGSLILAIQNGAQQSNLRAFAFNQLSENNYANLAFSELTATVVNIVMVHAYLQNQTNDVQGLIQYAVNKGLDFFMAFSVYKHPGLQQYINQEQAQSIQNLLAELNNYQTQFSQLHQQLQNGGQNNFNQRPGFSQGNMVNTNIPSVNRFSNTSSSVFSGFNNNPINNNQNSTPMESLYTSRYAALQEAENTSITDRKEPKVVSAKPEIQVTHTEPEDYKTSSLVWSRTEDQNYPPIVRFSENQILIKQEPNEPPKLIIDKRSENSVFDYETHTALSSLRVYPSTEPRMTNQEIRAINENVFNIIKQGQSILDIQMMEEGAEVPIFKIIKYPNYSIENSLESALFESEVTAENIRGMLSLEHDEILVFITNSILIENLGVLSENEEKEINFLSNSKTLDELHSRLKASAASLSKKAWRTIESKLTRIINEALRLQLAMDLRIDSFLSDYEDLVGVLNSGPETVKTAFFAHQKELISFSLKIEDDPKMVKMIDATFLSDDPNSDSGIEFKFLKNEASVVNLSMSCEELNVDVYKDLGSLILERESKVLYELAHHLFTSIPQTQFFTYFYVYTTDGVALRITRGLIGTDHFTLSVAKK